MARALTAGCGVRVDFFCMLTLRRRLESSLGECAVLCCAPLAPFGPYRIVVHDSTGYWSYVLYIVLRYFHPVKCTRGGLQTVR